MENNNGLVRITVVDAGNYNMKYMGKGEMGSFSSKVSTDEQPFNDAYDRIEIDGKITYIGQFGELSREYNKVDRNLLPQLLFAICKANNDVDTITTNITTMLPILQMTNKSKIIEQLKSQNPFKVKVNGKDKTIFIKQVAVLPESFTSFYDMTKEQQKEDVCIVDCGSRTVNVCTFINNGKLEKTATLKLGSLDFFKKVKSIEASKGKDYVEEDIERLINNGKITVAEKQYKDFFNEILNSIKADVNIDNYSTYFTGGTAKMFQKYIPSGCKLFVNPLYSNLNGALKASELKWGKVVNG
ncbi:ParM/StbA family protein [Clostridium botulinum]|uniref:ParM/StbA family protein n=1 Tax=Clostridium botulinum TaxID=1491 RepID=UPI0013F09499|nr:ParM/StbA family protein [Clostridium botulinum]MBN1061295.1 heat-shock protein Hsp70 [Clostridium botulinum]NFF21936.1 ParM/StbA family protein [Clostridium botulinum]NFI49638.1 ParM/StbA family protein [Clostridium botulinum]NFI58568.1 ParM/StbA family protein [Clostridium botulinum]NFI69391.1 ParM/StbA family protein [Clostridium botulinum]